LIRKYRFVSILIIFGLILASQFSFVFSFGGDYSFPIIVYENDVACIINNEFEKRDQQPVVDIWSLNNNITMSQLELRLFGIPILDHSHGYRIIINWNGLINWSYILNRSNINWDYAVSPTSNVTFCYAGGISGNGISNGSYTQLYNSTGNSVFTEFNNDNVIVDSNTIIFPFNQTLITTPSNPVNVLVLTTYNTTKSEISGETTTFLDVIWMDSIPDNYIINLFTLVTLDQRIDAIIFTSTLILLGALQAIYLKKRK
jgi:hypothetical protein